MELISVKGISCFKYVLHTEIFNLGYRGMSSYIASQMILINSHFTSLIEIKDLWYNIIQFIFKLCNTVKYYTKLYNIKKYFTILANLARSL